MEFSFENLQIWMGEGWLNGNAEILPIPKLF